MEIFLAIIGSGALSGFVVWLATRKKTNAETQGIHIDNQIKYSDLANNLFDDVLELKRLVGELQEIVRQERTLRQQCQERLTALEKKITS